MKIVNTFLSIVVALFFSTNIAQAQCGNLYIAGLIDGPLPSGTPKAIQLCATGNIANLSIYGLESVSNGNGSSGSEEFTFTAESLSNGDCIWLTNNQVQFFTYFGFAACYEDNVINVNGDDALLLYCNGTVVDVAGDPDNDGSGMAWEYTDGWMYAGDTNANATFNDAEWTYSSPNALDGSNTNAEAATPYPNTTADCSTMGVGCPNLNLNVGDPCDDGDATTTNDVVTAACECQGTGSGLAVCDTIFWEVASPLPNPNANSNNGEWTAIANGFSVNGYCGGGCIEPVSTWLVYGPYNLSGVSELDLTFEAAENFGGTDLTVAYTTNYSSACPSTANWTTAATVTDPGTIEVDLSAASGTQVYIGIEYTDDGADGYSDWDLTGFQLLADNCPTVGTPITSNCNTMAGCTDASACNYNSSANFNDGSCLYTGNTCDDGDGTTDNDMVTAACVCQGTNSGLDNCGTPAWEVISPTPNLNAFNNFGQWETIADGFSANGYCGSGCAEPVSTWLVYGPLNLSNTSTLKLYFDASETFDMTDLAIAYTNNYSSACPATANWTTAGTITESGAANIDLSSASGNQVYIGIEYADDGADNYSDWELTNFQLLANSCPAVGNPVVSDCNMDLGCIDAMACNYNASAEIDDGSCYFTGDTCDDGNNTTSNDVWVNCNTCEGDPFGACPASAKINEFHYDNDGTDVNEFVEIAITANADPSIVQVDLYNGNNGASYNAILLSSNEFVSSDGTFDYYVWMPSSSIQNGNDGIAVSCADGTLYQFITYEGAFMATDGPFAGEMGMDIGVEETGDMTDTQSIMNDGMGNFIVYCTANPGAANDISSCGCDPMVNNACTTTCTQTINLNPGWNQISLDVSPADKTAQSVFGGLQPGNLEIVTGFDNGALLFDPTFPAPFNTLQDVEDGFGYWVKVQNADVLEVEGVCIDDDFRKPFDAGWNLVAYPPDAPQSPATYFADLIANGNLEFISGFDQGLLLFDPTFPGPFNTLQQMENGFGYWVKVLNPSAKKVNNLTNVFSFIHGSSNLPVGEQVNIISETGETLAVLKVVEDGYLMTTPIYGDDPTTTTFKENISIDENLRFSWNNQILDFTTTFKGDYGIEKVELKFKLESLVNSLSVKAYPVPAKDVLNFEIKVKNATDLFLQVFDNKGSLVESIDKTSLSAGKQVVNYNVKHLTPGIYTYQLVTDNQLIAGKFNVLR